MYKQCKTPQSLERQKHIAQSFLHLMKKVPYSKVSISALCRESYISRNVFYRYFDSIDDVFSFIADELMQAMESFVPEHPESEPYSLLWDMERFFLFWYTQREILHTIIENNLTDVLFDRIVQNAYARHEGASRMTYGQSEELFPLTLTFSFYGLASLLLRWHSNDYRSTPQEMADAALELLTHPLFHSNP